jgi:hypothetical protein
MPEPIYFPKQGISASRDDITIVDKPNEELRLKILKVGLCHQGSESGDYLS